MKICESSTAFLNSKGVEVSGQLLMSIAESLGPSLYNKNKLKVARIDLSISRFVTKRLGYTGSANEKNAEIEKVFKSLSNAGDRVDKLALYYSLTVGLEKTNIFLSAEKRASEGSIVLPPAKKLVQEEQEEQEKKTVHSLPQDPVVASEPTAQPESVIASTPVVAVVEKIPIRRQSQELLDEVVVKADTMNSFFRQKSNTKRTMNRLQRDLVHTALKVQSVDRYRRINKTLWNRVSLLAVEKSKEKKESDLHKEHVKSYMKNSVLPQLVSIRNRN